MNLMRWSMALLVALIAVVIQACGRPIPSNYSYERIPERYDEVRRSAEVIEVDNCESDLAVERTVSRSIQLSETVMLDEEQVKSIALQPGVSAELGLGIGSGGVSGGASLGAHLQGEIRSEVAREFGAGLESGQSRKESIAVGVNPHRKAIVTLEWIETWEHGRFIVRRDGTSLGSVSYGLLKDIRLDSRIQSVDCGWWGNVRSMIVKTWDAKVVAAWDKGKASWPLRHLEITLPAIGMVLGISMLVLRRLLRKSL